MGDWRRALALAVVLGLTAAAAGAIWYARFQPDPRRFAVRGIDVSRHQGQVDWTAVAQDGVRFAYLKASEGGAYRDPSFAGNWSAARRAGLAVGAYHYFTFCRSGREQAANFLAATPHAADALPPVLDLEFGGNCAVRPGPQMLRRQIEAFLAPVEAREGKAAILYLTPEFQAAYGDALPDRPLWRRSIAVEPIGGPPWLFWQYHNRGQVKGVTGPVDLNAYAGGVKGLARLAGG
jgi:lysozyme